MNGGFVFPFCATAGSRLGPPRGSYSLLLLWFERQGRPPGTKTRWYQERDGSQLTHAMVVFLFLKQTQMHKK